MSGRLSEGGIAKIFAPHGVFLEKKAEKISFFPGRARKKSIFLNNQGGTLDIFALVPPPYFGHGTPLYF